MERQELAHKRVRPPWIWGLLTAAVLLIVLLALSLREGRRDLTGPEASAVQAELAAVEEVPPSAQALAQIREGRDDSALELGMKAYADGDYDRAFFLFRDAVAEDATSPVASFYLGICYLKRGFPNGAVGALETAAGLGDGPYREISLWYVSKAYFQLGLTEKGIETLRQVSAMNGTYQDRAHAALDKALRLPRR